MNANKNIFENKKTVFITIGVVILLIIILVVMLLILPKNKDNSNQSDDNSTTTTTTVVANNVDVENEESLKEYPNQFVGNYEGDLIKKDTSTAFKESAVYYKLFKTIGNETIMIRSDSDAFSLLCTSGFVCPGTKIRIYTKKTGEKYTYAGIEYDVYEYGNTRADFNSYNKDDLDNMVNNYINKLNNSYTKAVFYRNGKYIESNRGIVAKITSSGIDIELEINDDVINGVHTKISFYGKNYDDFDSKCRSVIVGSAFGISDEEFYTMYNNAKERTDYDLGEYAETYWFKNSKYNLSYTISHPVGDKSKISYESIDVSLIK